jgi:prepilin-type N-terminal cleavage/methylation domain-containing protein
MIIRKHTLKSVRGFTLIEMAIVILLVGVAVAAAAPLYNQYIKEQELQKTRANIELVSTAAYMAVIRCQPR